MHKVIKPTAPSLVWGERGRGWGGCCGTGSWGEGETQAGANSPQNLLGTEISEAEGLQGPIKGDLAPPGLKHQPEAGQEMGTSPDKAAKTHRCVFKKKHRWAALA